MTWESSGKLEVAKQYGMTPWELRGLISQPGIGVE